MARKKKKIIIRLDDLRVACEQLLAERKRKAAEHMAAFEEKLKGMTPQQIDRHLAALERKEKQAQQSQSDRDPVNVNDPQQRLKGRTN